MRLRTLARTAATLASLVVWLATQGPAPALAFDNPGTQPPQPIGPPACDPQAPDGCLVDDASVVSTPTPPVISVWYGDTQTFGQWGRPQTWVNVLGNISDPGDTVTAVYSLNGGPPIPLNFGPDTRRLAALGDFNVELATASLLVGQNQVVITATDSLANQTIKTVNFTYFAPGVWPLPYSLDWGAAASINSVAQVVDGLWYINAGRLRPAQLAYDRLVALGDVTWTDYEVTAPITIHSLDPGGYASPSLGPGVGLILRWTGHTDSPAVCAPGYQPHCGWLPLGALGWYRWSPPDGTTQRLVMIGGNSGGTLAQDNSGRTLALNTDYLFKMRVETIPAQGGLYRLKVWETAQPEPAGWDLSALRPLAEPQQGSAILVAHHVDAGFGNVSVTPGPFGSLAASTTASDDFNACALNGSRWTLADPLGDSTAGLTGEFTNNARFSLAVPGGTRHDLWPATNTLAPRLMQSVNDTDFDLVVKFDSAVASEGQLQGLLIEQDADDFVRFDFYRQSSSTRIFAAAIADNTVVWSRPSPPSVGGVGVAPLYMRVRREADLWTQMYSLNGQDWTILDDFTHALTVSRVGVFAGNAGSNPAHTALADYFFNSLTPVAPEDGARNTLTVNVAGQGNVARDPVSSNYDCDETVTLTATPAAGWSFAGWGGGVQSSANPLQVSMTGPQTITATFTLPVYLPLITKH